MGAEVIIFGQSLNSQFLKGLTHSAVKGFNDDQLSWRYYAICFLIAKLTLHHIIDCWGTAAGQPEDIYRRQGGATNYVLLARIRRRTAFF